jgi:hypothetical protein
MKRPSLALQNESIIKSQKSAGKNVPDKQPSPEHHGTTGCDPYPTLRDPLES